jgi:hypothetical protein
MSALSRCCTTSGFTTSGIVTSGFVKSGIVKSGIVKIGIVKSGIVKSGIVKSGIVKSGIVKSGIVTNRFVTNWFTMSCLVLLRVSPFVVVLLFGTGLTVAAAARAGERTVAGVSEWEPERELALREADRRARAAVQAWLEQTFGAAPDSQQLARWLDHPAVARSETVEQRERAYGELSRATVAYTIESSIWERWRIEQDQRAARHRHLRLARVVLTVLAVVATAGGSRLWDRRTHGYDRIRIALVSLPLCVAASAAIWLV